jgi:signal transduction histidine kinase
VESLVKMHRGTLTAERELGRGSTFRVSLPVVTSPLHPFPTRG